MPCWPRAWKPASYKTSAWPKEETALLIGAATGYMAALMAHLAQRVVAIDSRRRPRLGRPRQPEEGRHQQRRSRPGRRHPGLPWPGALRRHRAGRLGGRSPVLLDQLKPGGRLVAVVGQLPMMYATRYTREGQGPVQQPAAV